MKTIFVSGSVRGIGKAIAQQFADSGFRVALHASKESEVAQNTLKDIKKSSPGSMLFVADITKKEEIDKLCKEVNTSFPEINVLVNNAGITRDRTFQKMSYDEWHQVIDTNLNGVFRITHALLPFIPESGRIISISSVIGLMGGFGQTNYSASKSALIGFTKSLALELARKKITVNAICPGFTATEMTEKIPKNILEEKVLPRIPLGRMALPKEIAKLAFYLSSEEAGYITGQAVNINGGLY